MSQNKGFTLIELLVVIAIIGILAAAALASLGSARTKGQEAAVKSQLANMRAQAELYFASTGANTYGTATTGVDALCNEVTTPTSMFMADSTANGLAGLIAGVTASYAAAAPACVSTGTAWAVSATLPDATSYCVDSTGKSGTGAADASGACV